MSCYLNRFCNCLHLYWGCVIIGFAGFATYILLLIFAIVATFDNVGLVILAAISFAIFLVSKACLLIAIFFDLCPCVLISFIFAIIALLFLIAWWIWLMIVLTFALPPILGMLLIIVELYFAWVIISYWHLCRRCDCPN